MKINKVPSIFGGAMIAAGTMIGAGMLSLPIASAGMWFTWTVIVMVVTVFFMHLSAEMILEVNLNYDPGASFHTLVKDNLGRIWSIINGLSVAFVLYILLYAYVDGSGSVISGTIENNYGITVPKPLAGLIFSILFTAMVWWGAKMVDRISSVLMIGMFLTLFAALTGLLNTISFDFLFNSNGPNRYAIYAFASLPFYLTSFCFHASVPSFVKYYGSDQGRKIRMAILIGMIITFVFYFGWMISIMGNIPRLEFLNVGADQVKWLLNQIHANQFFDLSLRIFAFFAVVTSFLGAGLGLFDYIADLFGFDNSKVGRLKTATITFLPPTLLGIALPNGFVLAIGFAGLFAAIWSVIVPALTVIQYRKKHPSTAKENFIAMGGKWMPYIIIIYGVIAACSHLLVEVFDFQTLNFFAK